MNIAKLATISILSLVLFRGCVNLMSTPVARQVDTSGTSVVSGKAHGTIPPVETEDKVIEFKYELTEARKQNISEVASGLSSVLNDFGLRELAEGYCLQIPDMDKMKECSNPWLGSVPQAYETSYAMAYANAYLKLYKPELSYEDIKATAEKSVTRFGYK